MEREEVGEGRAEGSSAIGDGGQAAISLMPDVDGIGSDFLLDSILSTLLEKWSSDVWVVVYQLHRCFYSCFQTCWASCKNTLLYSIQQSTQKHNPLKRMHPQDNVSQTHEPTYRIGHVSASSHLWKFVTWRFVCRGLTVPATSCCLQTDLEPVSRGTSKWAGSQLSGGSWDQEEGKGRTHTPDVNPQRHDSNGKGKTIPLCDSLLCQHLTYLCP